MLKSQRNTLFELVTDAGFDPSQFRWSRTWDDEDDQAEDLPEDVYALDYSSEFWFIIDLRDNEWSCRYSPGLERDAAEFERLEGWPAIVDHFKTWLGALRRETSEVDLWGELENERELSGGETTVANTRFSPSEQAEIARQLEELKAYMREAHDLSNAQLTELESRLDYIKDAATRMGRLDWRNTMTGVLLGAVVQGLVPQSAVRDALQMIVRGVAVFFGHEVPQLPT